MSQRHYNTARWRRVRLDVLERDQHECQVGLHGVCTGTADVVDHVVPIADGGAVYDMENLRAACRACNSTLGGITGLRRRELLVVGEPCPTCGHVFGTVTSSSTAGKPVVAHSSE